MNKFNIPICDYDKYFHVNNNLIYNNTWRNRKVLTRFIEHNHFGISIYIRFKINNRK